MLSFWKKIFIFGKDLVYRWNEKSLDIYGAALSFYTLFALGPLLLLSIFTLTLIFGEEHSRDFFFNLIESLGSDYLLKTAHTVVESQQGQDPAYVASIVGASTLALGCILFFNNLQSALNGIWELSEEREHNPIKLFLSFVIKSLVMPALIGFFLVLALSLRLIIDYLKRELPLFARAADLLNLGILSDLTSLLFASFVIGASLAWLLRSRILKRYAILIGFVMSLVMIFGKNIFGWYAQSQSVSSFYGAAGSMIVLMLWIYISIRLFLFLNLFIQMLNKRRNLKS